MPSSRRSRRRACESMRPACAATSRAWVTSTNVWAFSRFSRSISCMTSSAESRVQVAGRLVGEDHRWLGRQRARDRHALLLAARQLARPVPQAVLEPDHLERAQRPPPRLARRTPREQQRQLDVLERVQHGQQVVALEHEAHAPRAVVGLLPIGQPRQAAALRAAPRPPRSPPGPTGSAAASSCRSPTARRWRRSRRARCAGSRLCSAGTRRRPDDVGLVQVARLDDGGHARVDAALGRARSRELTQHCARIRARSREDVGQRAGSPPSSGGSRPRTGIRDARRPPASARTDRPAWRRGARSCRR